MNKAASGVVERRNIGAEHGCISRPRRITTVGYVCTLTTLLLPLAEAPIPPLSVPSLCPNTRTRRGKAKRMRQAFSEGDDV